MVGADKLGLLDSATDEECEAKEAEIKADKLIMEQELAEAVKSGYE